MKQERAGELFIFFEALLWSFFPIVSGLLLITFPPIFTLSVSTLIAGVFFAFVLTIKKLWHELLIRHVWKDLLIMIFLLSILFYLLVFFGLQYTTAGNAGIVLLMEVFFTMFLLSVITKKEQLTSRTMWGGALMVLGAFFIIFQGSFVPNKGDAIIFLATAIPPFGNYFMKRIRKSMSAYPIMFIRSIIAGICLLILSYAIETISLKSISLFHVALFAINGILLFGLSKVFWIEAIHRMTISKTISLASMTAAFTLFFAYIILKDVPTIFQISGLIPIVIGVRLLTHNKTTYASNRTKT